VFFIVEFYQFYNEEKFFWIVPSDLPDGTIIGFVLRGFFRKNYRMFAVKGMPQLTYGWFDFGG